MTPTHSTRLKDSLRLNVGRKIATHEIDLTRAVRLSARHSAQRIRAIAVETVVSWSRISARSGLGQGARATGRRAGSVHPIGPFTIN